MNWRWLIMDYVDPKLGLSFEQRREVRWYIRTNSDWTRKPRGIAWRQLIFAAVPAAVMMLTLLPVFVFNMNWTYLFVILPSQLALSWLAMAVVGRWAHGPMVFAALRHFGYDVCAHCGYDLRGLGDGADRCPECGVERSVEDPS